MTVVDRYLTAVRIFLPRSAQRDIIAELSEDIHSRIEDREGTLGRPLTAAEQEAIVADFGHPALLAGRYGRRRCLIGPEIFPFYWLVLGSLNAGTTRRATRPRASPETAQGSPRTSP